MAPRIAAPVTGRCQKLDTVHRNGGHGTSGVRVRIVNTNGRRNIVVPEVPGPRILDLVHDPLNVRRRVPDTVEVDGDRDLHGRPDLRNVGPGSAAIDQVDGIVPDVGVEIHPPAESDGVLTCPPTDAWIVVPGSKPHEASVL